MKTKSLFILFLFTGCFSMGAYAQKNIMALVKKCETIESVDMNVIRKRNKDTKKLEEGIVTVKIKSNPSLIDEFIDAFKKDENDATEVIENKKNGKLTPQLYKFDNLIITFNFKDNGNATISIINEKVSPGWGG